MTQNYNILLFLAIHLWFFNVIYDRYICIIRYYMTFRVLKRPFMTTFGKKLKEAREAKGLSQSELGRLLETNHSIIGKYERDEVKPTIDAVKRLANVLDTSVGFLVDESGDSDIFKDNKMVKRLKDISSFSDSDKDYILYTLDALINNVKLKNITQ